MRSDIAGYVRNVVAVREPAPDFEAILARSLRLRACARPGNPPGSVMPALIAIVVLAFVFAGQIASPVLTASSVRTPAPAPAQT
jgi:hypothetical protein